MYKETDDDGRNVLVLVAGDAVKRKAPWVLNSGALGPCIAAGISHKLFQTGYMIHEEQDNLAKF